MLGFSPSLPSSFLALFKLISLFYQHSRWSMLGIQSNKFTNHLKKHTRAQAGSLLFVWFIFKGLDGGQIPSWCNPALLYWLLHHQATSGQVLTAATWLLGKHWEKIWPTHHFMHVKWQPSFLPPAEGKDSAAFPGCHHKQDAEGTSQNVLWNTVGQDLKQRRAESTEIHLQNTSFHLCTQLFWGRAKGMLCLHTL